MRTGTEVHLVHVFFTPYQFPGCANRGGRPVRRDSEHRIATAQSSIHTANGCGREGASPLKTPVKGMRTIDKKTVKHTLRMTESESEMLRRWAEKAGITQAEFVRQKVFGHTPVPLPGNVFWNHMTGLYSIHDRLHQEEIKADLRSLILAIQSEATTPREVTDNGNDKAVAH